MLLARTSNIDVNNLTKRVVQNRTSVNETLKLGAAHRTRSSDLLTNSVLLVLDLISTGIDKDETAYQAIANHPAVNAGERTKGPSETRIARMCLGPEIDRKRVHRVASAARELQASKTNNPVEYLASHGGVTGCAELWTMRCAAEKGGAADAAPTPPKKISQDPPTGAAAWAARHLGRLVPAVLRIGPAGAFTVAYVRGPSHVLIEVINKEEYERPPKRLIKEVRRSRSEPLQLVVTDGHELQKLIVDGIVRVVAQADDSDSPLLAIPAAEAAVDTVEPTTALLSV
jgi:hypothetical protein